MIKMTRLRRVRWAWNEGRMGQKCMQSSERKLEGKGPIPRLKSTKMDLKKYEGGCGPDSFVSG
jgi:hypothetical protein